MAEFVQQLSVGLTLGSVYALVALGYSLVFSTLRVVNFAQGHLVMLSSLTTVTLWDGRGWPLPAAIGAAVLVSAGVGLALEKMVTLPMRGTTSPLAWIVATLAAAIVIENVAAIVFGKDPRPFPSIVGGEPFRVAGATIPRDNVVVVAAALAIMLAIDLLLRRTVWGKAVRATAFSPWVPRLMGVPVPRVVTMSFVCSGVLGGLAGPLVGPVYKDAATNIGLPLGLFGFIAIVIGGMGSTAGALVGGLVLGLAQSVLRGQLPPGLGTGAIFAFLIALLVVRPNGLFGRAWPSGEGLA